MRIILITGGNGGLGRAMAREWLGQAVLEGPRASELRFDAIGVSFDAAGRLLALEHLEAAF